jgi:hypothetical protein
MPTVPTEPGEPAPRATPPNETAPSTSAPSGTLPADRFYAEDRRRVTSSDLSYGSGWRRLGWSDDTHVVELYWLGATRELAAFYVAYDWGRVDPEEMTVGASEILGEETGSGVEVGHALRVLDEAAAAVYVEVLGSLASDLACHEVMWGWRRLQHHPDGLDHIRARVAQHLSGQQSRSGPDPVEG